MKKLNHAQTQKIKAFGLTIEDISKVEKSTGWCYAQNTRGSDIRFRVQKVSGKYELVIWLHSAPESLISIGVWVDRDKGELQKLFNRKLGTWSPVGMTSDGYTNEGRNPGRGHVGDWNTDISARSFMKNFALIRKMVDEIETKLTKTGLSAVLNNL